MKKDLTINSPIKRYKERQKDKLPFIYKVYIVVIIISSILMYVVIKKPKKEEPVNNVFYIIIILLLAYLYVTHRL